MRKRTIATVMLWLISATMCMPGQAQSEWQRTDIPVPDWLIKRLAPENRGLLAPVRVIQVTYKNAPAYLLVSPCCDMSDRLYSESGELLCIYGLWHHPTLERACKGTDFDQQEGILIWARQIANQSNIKKEQP